MDGVPYYELWKGTEMVEIFTSAKGAMAAAEQGAAMPPVG